ncbi:TIGR04282 family arsenosugar biosynthesis glycosyltransferase [Nonlabens ponticola]|nr:DUF2064 domain-containing protein [Nonlabens ponticola]
MAELNGHVLKTVRKSGLDYFHITESDQHGDSFGARFSNAIQSVFEKGYEQVICVGNDTPQLTTLHIFTAVDSLATGHAVNGPSIDGGYYLMGIHAHEFDAGSFESLPWQTENLATAYRELQEDIGIISDNLEPLMDLDSASDLYQFVKGKDSRKCLINIIKHIFDENSQVYATQSDRIYQIVFSSPLNKGSPTALAA